MASTMFTKSHVQHHGELDVQRRRNVPAERAELLQRITSDAMPDQHASFFQDLLYLTIATVDKDGRVWATLLVGANVTRVLSSSLLTVRASLSDDDPFASAVLNGGENQLFALLGVDFSNRRRNKAAGIIRLARGTPGDLQLVLETNENLGNCPKYITVRTLVPHQRSPRTVFKSLQQSETASLTPAAEDLITRASTLWIASEYTADGDEWVQSDVGLNHRGGSPGFVRVYSEGGHWFVCIPDYSGNRFYQTLGSIQASRVAGLLVPDFQSGSLLHLTGDAENLFDAEAEALMPRVTLVTRIKITGAVLIEDSINLLQVSPDTLSPYNPPIRYLAREQQQHSGPAIPASSDNTATLVGIRRLTRSTIEFTFELASPVTVTPGAYIILNFAHAKERHYAHMNDANPQALNDDYIRTWTISGVASHTHVSCTIKLVPGGAISPFLHSLAHVASTATIPRLTLPCLGVAGDFTCFSPDGSVPNEMLWVAGGVGITPFLSFWQAITQRKLKCDVVVLFACRLDDVRLVQPFLDYAGTEANLKVTVFISDGEVLAHESTVDMVNRRLRPSDIVSHEARSRSAYVCGSTPLTDMVVATLEAAKCPAIHRETFSF